MFILSTYFNIMGGRNGLLRWTDDSSGICCHMRKRTHTFFALDMFIHLQLPQLVNKCCYLKKYLRFKEPMWTTQDVLPLAGWICFWNGSRQTVERMSSRLIVLHL